MTTSYPLWNEPGLSLLYLQKSYDFSPNFAVHLWESNARKWFLMSLNPTKLFTLDLPIFCEMSKFVDPPANLALEVLQTRNCAITVENVHSDGLVAHYDFSRDFNEKVIDVMGNRLHGWAVNGTTLVKGYRDDGVTIDYARRFHGHGDFIVLPVHTQFKSRDFTVRFGVNFNSQCQAAASVIGIQSERNVFLLEGICQKDAQGDVEHTFWMKVYDWLDP